MQILYKCISDRTGVINDKFEKILFPAKTTGYRFQNNFLLHHEYTIPKGFDPYWFESFCWYMLWARKREILTPMSWGQVLDLRGEIVLLNPTLDVFTPRISPETVYHILCGVASQFTVDDIWYFVFERFPKG